MVLNVLEYLKEVDTMFILSPLLVPQMPTQPTSLLQAAITKNFYYLILEMPFLENLCKLAKTNSQTPLLKLASQKKYHMCCHYHIV